MIFEGAKGIAEGRRQLAGDAFIARYRLTPEEAEADPAIREALDPRSFPAARLARAAGFDVELEAHEWDNGEIFGLWRVHVPEDVERQLEALVWDSGDRVMEYTLTRSTSYPGWQMTNWMRDGQPWGHSDLDTATEAFDTSPTASGQSLAGLAQIVFRDGRVLVRQGAKRIEFNPFVPVDPRAPVSISKHRAYVEKTRREGKAVAEHFGLGFHEGRDAYKKLWQRHGIGTSLAQEHWEYLGEDWMKRIFGGGPILFGGHEVWVPLVDEHVERIVARAAKEGRTVVENSSLGRLKRRLMR